MQKAFQRIGRVVSVFCMFAFVPTLLGYQEEAIRENSTEKKRAVPDTLSKKAGAAIEWESDYSAALAKSKETGKPIFWYVPTVPGTFMDRKEEVHRYMMAGPFSWPSIIRLINQNCVPLKLIPKRDLVNKFSIKVYQFVEPGFLIVQPTEEVTLLANRMTTLHPYWIFRILANALGDTSSWEKYGGDAGRSDQFDGWLKELAGAIPIQQSSIDNALKIDSMESQLLAGMLAFRMGQHDEATRIWHDSALLYPDHPLAWKAACEAQGLGPFSRGFEVFSDLPESAFTVHDAKNITSAALAKTYSEKELWLRSVDYLLGMQNENGGFFDSYYDFGGTDSLDNVHVAVTSLVGLALLEAERRSEDLYQKQRIHGGIDRVLSFVSNDSNLNLIDRDEILWAQAYRIRFLAAMQKQEGYERVVETLQRAVGQLERLQLNTGGWYHEYANSFVSGTALTALFAAKDSGAKVDDKKITSGLNRLASQRLDNGAYPYATRRENGKNEGTKQDIEGSGGRISICELARKRWGQVNEEDFSAAVIKSMEYHDLLAKALKYDNHTSTYGYGGFFFWYDMQARSEAIHLIADPKIKQQLASQQRELILNLPELDGCFVDSHELGRCYGTAMGLLSLSFLD